MFIHINWQKTVKSILVFATVFGEYNAVKAMKRNEAEAEGKKGALFKLAGLEQELPRLGRALFK